MTSLVNRRQSPFAVVLFALVIGRFAFAAEDGLDQEATWEVASALQVRRDVLDWIGSRKLEAEIREQVDTMWSVPVVEDGQQLLRRVMATLSLADERVTILLAGCEQAVSPHSVPVFEWLEEGPAEDFVVANSKLYLGRWYSMNQMYDEALMALSELEPENVVDPASLLFHRSVAHYRLRQKKEGLESLAKLLENREELPKRYSTVADLMRADLETLKEDSLDEIARIMDSVRVRLGLGRAGTRVRGEEDEVIRKLDKLIEEAEKQRQQMQQQMGQSSQGGNRPSQPMQDSMLPQMRASGDAGTKKLDEDEIEWGNLPPKERQEALQSLGKEFPSHYREVIEEYFRSLAQESASADQ